MHRPSDQGSSGRFHYSLFGLNVRSDLSLPELRLLDPMDDVDVWISVASDAEEHAGTLLAIGDVAHFYVDGGSRIIVVPDPGVPDRNVRLFLLGSAMGILLHQRALLPLHANSVEIDGKAVAFMGASGAGKSTLAAAFHDAGVQVITDDVCVVRFDEGGAPGVSPGLPRLRLWKDALDATGRVAEQFQRSYAGDDSYEKYDVPVGAEGASLELIAAYLLQPADEFAIVQLTGIDAVEAVFANTYRGGYIPETGNFQIHWEDCLRLVGRVPIFALNIPRDHARLPEMIGRILTHVRSAPLDS